MKKYLLFLGCACMALSAFADDSAVTQPPSSSKNYVGVQDLRPNKPSDEEQGGKPRIPGRPLSRSDFGDFVFSNTRPDIMSSSASDDSSPLMYPNAQKDKDVNLYLVDLFQWGIGPLGGKPRDPGRPLSSGDFGNYLWGKGPSIMSSSAGEESSPSINFLVHWSDFDLQKADLIQWGVDPLGGKPRDPGRPLSSGDFINFLKGNKNPGVRSNSDGEESSSVNCSGDEDHINLIKYEPKQFVVVVGDEEQGGKPRVPIVPGRPKSVTEFIYVCKGNGNENNSSVMTPSAGNNSGKVTIADVTTLIDQLLTGTQSEGKSIADVTKMIDQILAGNNE